MRYGEKYWYWNTIPPQFERFVCKCERFSPGFNYEKHLPICKVCGKLNHVMIKKCTNCEELFLKDFHVPSFCQLNPLCWDCLDKDAPICEHIPWGLIDLYQSYGVVPPQIMKRVDISDFHDFDF